MTADGHDFLKELASFPANSFEGRFFRMSAVLGLGEALSQSEIMLLYESGFYATLCNISFNGLGGCGGLIKADRETNRIRLEQAFMAARQGLYATTGWAALPPSAKESVEQKLLSVRVAADSLAW